MASYVSKIALKMNKCIFGNIYTLTTTPIYAESAFFLSMITMKESNYLQMKGEKARISSNIALSQQIKNLKVNIIIINKNQSLYSSTSNQSLAKNFIGLSGYIYTLEKLDEVFAAKRLLY
jgi:hypothetical protein